jgi:hypothetical protein
MHPYWDWDNKLGEVHRAERLDPQTSELQAARELLTSQPREWSKTNLAWAGFTNSSEFVEIYQKSADSVVTDFP